MRQRNHGVGPRTWGGTGELAGPTAEITRRRWLGQIGAVGVAATFSSTSMARRARAAADTQPGSQLLVYGTSREQEALRGLLVVDPENGTWRRIVDARLPFARLSPDGRTLLYCEAPGSANDPNRSVWVCAVDGHDEPRKIAEPATLAFWSPDGREALVTNTGTVAGEPGSSWLVKADGSGRKTLGLPENEFVIEWSPDGEWLLTSAVAGPKDERRPRREHLLRKRDGSAPIHSAPLEGGVTFRFLPDGRSLSFLRQESRTPTRYSLHVANRDGSSPRQLIASTPELYPYHHCWSPDGKRLAVNMVKLEKVDGDQYGRVGGHLEIFTSDGKSIRRIEMPQQEAQPFDWR